MPRIRLITRADDLGAFAGATPAAIDAHRRGILRNVSVMVPTPWFADAVEALRGVPSLCVGIHLTACCEWRCNRWRPLLPSHRIPTLVDDEGWLKSDPLAIHRAGVSLDELLRECQAQLDRARAAGLAVRYVDTHMVFDWIHEPGGPPRAADLLAPWAARNGVRWYQSPAIPGLPAAPVPHADPRADLIARLTHAAPGTYLLVTHPCWAGSAIATEDLGRGPGHVQDERLADAALLADPTLHADLRRLDVETVRYDELS